MGLITWFLGKMFYPLLFSGGATYFAFRLGQELPLAAKKAGHSLGMSYNYFKVTIRVGGVRINPAHSFSHRSPSRPTRSSRSSGRPRSRRTPSPVSSSTRSRRRRSSSRRSCPSLASTPSRTTSNSSSPPQTNRPPSKRKRGRSRRVGARPRKRWAAQT